MMKLPNFSWGVNRYDTIGVWKIVDGKITTDSVVVK